jgi:hypothetical protein
LATARAAAGSSSYPSANQPKAAAGAAKLPLPSASGNSAVALASRAAYSSSLSVAKTEANIGKAAPMSSPATGQKAEAASPVASPGIDATAASQSQDATWLGFALNPNSSFTAVLANQTKGGATTSTQAVETSAVGRMPAALMMPSSSQARESAVPARAQDAAASALESAEGALPAGQATRTGSVAAEQSLEAPISDNAQGAVPALAAKTDLTAAPAQTAEPGLPASEIIINDLPAANIAGVAPSVSSPAASKGEVSGAVASPIQISGAIQISGTVEEEPAGQTPGLSTSMQVLEQTSSGNTPTAPLPANSAGSSSAALLQATLLSDIEAADGVTVPTQDAKRLGAESTAGQTGTETAESRQPPLTASPQTLGTSLFGTTPSALSTPAGFNAGLAAIVQDSNWLLESASHLPGAKSDAVPGVSTPKQVGDTALFSSVQSAMLSSAVPAADSAAAATPSQNPLARSQASASPALAGIGVGEARRAGMPGQSSEKPTGKSVASAPLSAATANGERGVPGATAQSGTGLGLDSETGGAAAGEARELNASAPTCEKTLPGTAPTASGPTGDEDGMSAALQDGAMQKMQDANENAAPAEQNLPISAASFSVSHSSDREHKAALASMSANGTSTSTTAISPGAANGPQPAQTASVATDAQAARSVLAHRSIENLMRSFPRQDSGSVSVVLTPDANTQVALHVKMQQGQMQAQAVLERGDYSALKADWGSLQSRLSDQGVRLAPLSSSVDPRSSSGSGGSFSQQPQRDVQAENETPSLTSNKPRASQSAAPAATAHRREWWA